MNLRPYQQEDLIKCQRDIMAGKNRNLIVWATGLGKTVLMAHIVGKLRKKRALIIVNREELVWQTVDKIKASYPLLSVSVEKAEYRSTPDSEVVVASIQTIGSVKEEEDGTPIFSPRLQTLDPNTFDVVMVDECFVAGTMIDGKPIEEIKPGDRVMSLNHTTNTEEEKPVVRLFKSKPSSLMTIHLSNGKSITCTENHPFYVDGKYIPANRIKSRDILTPYAIDGIYGKTKKAKREVLFSVRNGVYTEELEQLNDSVLRSRVQEDSKGSEKEDSESPLLQLQERDRVLWARSTESKSKVCGLLQGMQGGNQTAAILSRERVAFGVQSKVCVKAHDRKQPDEKRGSSAFSIQKTEGDRPLSSCARREREGDDDNRENLTSESANLFNAGASVHNENTQDEQRGIPTSLQNRHSNTGPNDSNRGRWEISLCDREATSGPEETRTDAGVWVDRIEIHQQTSDGTFGGLCPGGVVYNFEVEGNNNYYANGVLVHNCHRSSADSYRNVLKYFGVYLSEQKYNDQSKILFGLTATPNRADNKGLDEFYNHITSNRDIRWGIQNKYLADIEAYRVETTVDISDVKITAGDFNHRQLEKKINTPSRNELVVKKYIEIAGGKKALFFTLDIQHAEDLAAELNKQGIPALAISSRTPDQRRKEIFAMHKSGEITALTGANIFLEGYDDPTIEVGCMVRPFRSGLIYRQAVGRVLRPCPAPEALEAMLAAGKQIPWIKPCAIVIDFVDVSSRHSLLTVPSLFGLNPKLDTKGRRMEDLTREMEKMVAGLPEKVKKKTKLEEIEDPAHLSGIVEKIDLISIPETPDEVSKVSGMSWIKKGETYILNLPSKTNTIKQNLMGMYEIRSSKNGVSSFLGVAPSLEDAVKKVEYGLSNEDRSFGNKTASWRDKPISDKQIDLLAKIDRSGVSKMNGDTNKYKQLIRTSMSAGQAQALISSILARRL